MREFFENLLVYIVVRLLYATYRFEFIDTSNRELAASHHPLRAFVFATWHGDALAGTLAHTYQKFSPLCSRSRDGALVAFICKRMGLKPARGSSSRGGKEARQELIEFAAQGYSPAITVDGPKGPYHEVKAGIIDVARKADLVIVPMLARAKNCWVLHKSWDKHQIPKPFSTVYVCYAPPIFVDRNGDEVSFAADQFKVKAALQMAEQMTDRCIRS